MSTGLKANNDGSAAIQVGGTDYIEISSTGNVTIPQSQTISGNLIVTGTATVGGQPVGGNYILNSYAAPATWTKGAGLKAIKVTVVGSGGNGGSGAPSSGGGGGGAAISYLPAPSIPGPVVVTAGPGTNSFGAFCSATAGSSGASGVPGTANGGSGGTGSGGTINVGGGAGGSATSPTTNFGSGGPSILGGGGAGNGGAGRSFGGGGGGGPGGGAGAPGIVIVEEFY